MLLKTISISRPRKVFFWSLVGAIFVLFLYLTCYIHSRIPTIKPPFHHNSHKMLREQENSISAEANDPFFAPESSVIASSEDQGIPDNNVFVLATIVADGAELHSCAMLNCSILEIIATGSIIVAEQYHEADAWVHAVFPADGWIRFRIRQLVTISIMDSIWFESRLNSICSNSSYLDGVDFPGGDLSDNPIAAASLLDCCLTCTKTASCSAFSFTTTGDCWLKSIANSFHRPKSTVVSGRINSKRHECCNAVNVSSKLHASSRIGRHSMKIDRNSEGVSWLEQWPIGNSKFGALIGGSFSKELIPVSVADLFVVEQDDEAGNNHDKERQAFLLARSLLREGKIFEAHQAISGMQDPGLGMFQYLADLALEYSSTFSREGTKFSDLESTLNNESQGIHHQSTAKVLVDQSILDMLGGVVTTSFVARNRKNRTVIHQREWFASAVDNVIVGKLSCNSFVPNDGNSYFYRNMTDIGCLNVAIKVSRVGTLTGSHPISIAGSPVPCHANQLIGRIGANCFLMKYSLIATPPLRVPETQLSIIIYCYGSAMVQEAHLSCSRASKLEIIISAVSQLGDSKNFEVDRSSMDIVDNAIVFSFDQLKQRHSTDFRAIMSRSDVNLHAFAKDDYCLQRSISDRIRSVGQSCRVLEPQRSLQSELSLIEHNYHYGKYLLISAGRKATINLQGIWTNGPISAWNGDYHMNINMQQAYWAADAVGASVVMEPLMLFLRKLAANGKQTARDVYGCRRGGWVSHAFTDYRAKTGMIGEAQWSLCVTCGAWMALHAWDHLLYHFDMKFLDEVVLPLLEGAAKFFLEYMWEDENGTMHTGPTTSPENSYVLFNHSDPKVANGRKYGFLAFSPAFDLSILRQLSRALSMSVRWAVCHGLLAADSASARTADSFSDLVRRMPNEGKPTAGELTNIIVEYPVIVGQDKIGEVESADPGHRHFSPMHWLYPGLLFEDDEKLFAAGRNFMELKSKSGGGHTSWSAAWEACLWARLRQGEMAFAAISRIILKFSAPNLLSLHPSLIPKNEPGCATCFEEDRRSFVRDSSAGVEEGRRNSGMVTATDDKFQIDGNLGFVAAVNELLVQCYLPGIIRLLPAIPSSMGSGTCHLHCRGDVEVSIAWDDSIVLSSKIIIRTKHPWFKSNEKIDTSLVILSPNQLVLVNSPCVELSAQSFTVPIEMELKILRFPCEINLQKSA